MIIILTFVSFIMVVAWLFIPKHIRLNEIARLHTEGELQGISWSWVGDTGDYHYDFSGYYRRNYGVDIPYVDTDKSILVISSGREIKSMTYTRVSKYENSWGGYRYVCKVVFKNELHPHTIFVYKAHKIRICTEEEAHWPIIIRIEGQPDQEIPYH